MISGDDGDHHDILLCGSFKYCVEIASGDCDIEDLISPFS